VAWNEFLCEYPSSCWNLFYFTRLCVLFGFQRLNMGGQVVRARAEVPPLVSAALAEKRKCGAKALRKNSV
jgi:hypothetical protein